MVFLLFSSFCCSDWPSTGLASSSKQIWESITETGKFYHGVAMCSHTQFCSKFFNQISEHFHADFRLHWANHSDLGIIGKIFSSFSSNLSTDDPTFGMTSQVKQRPILVTAGYGQHRSQWVNGFQILRVVQILRKKTFLNFTSLICFTI